MKKTQTIFILSVIIFHFFFCATADRMAEYRYAVYYDGISLNSQKSDQKIANVPTWQLFFTLHKPEKCLKFVFTSKLHMQTLKTTLTKEISTYFVIEKLVDISRYNIDKKNIFYEIGKNYDLRWNVSSIMVVCSDESDPLKKLTPGLYRIRFTALSPTEFYYRVEIFSSEEKVTFGF